MVFYKLIKRIFLRGLYLFYCLRKFTAQEGEVEPTRIKKILIVETAFLGDVVAVHPLIQETARCFPEAHICMVVQKQYGPLVKYAPCLSSCVTFEKSSFGEVLGCLVRLWGARYDLVICASPGVRNSLISLFAGRSLVTGYLVWLSSNTSYFQDHRIDSIGKRLGKSLLYRKEEHITVRGLKALLPLELGTRTVPTAPRLLLPGSVVRKECLVLEQQGFIKKQQVNLVVHAGASVMLRQWPVEKMVELLIRLKARCDSELNVTLVGVPSEEVFLKRICRGLPYDINVFAGYDLTCVLVLIKTCDLFLGMDSGPKYIADGFSRPLVELLGPQCPETVGALGNHVKTIFHDIGCNPCIQTECTREGECLREITVDEVLENIISLVDSLNQPHLSFTGYRLEA